MARHRAAKRGNNKSLGEQLEGRAPFRASNSPNSPALSQPNQEKRHTQHKEPAPRWLILFAGKSLEDLGEMT